MNNNFRKYNFVIVNGKTYQFKNGQLIWIISWK